MASKFKVIIAGGSITGLTLANMLEQVGINYVLLEAYSDIAPQVGASIGLWPHGLRILDQLGCYEAIRSLIEKPTEHGILVGPDGKPLKIRHNFNDDITENHGYPIIFVDRQQVLQILYDNLKDKSKILINKRVSSVIPQTSGIEVRVQDGSSYTGDILIGADGVHSTVRDEMWRIASLMEPDYIPESDHTSVPTYYNCIFGISKPMEGLPLRTAINTIKKHHSYLIITGPGGRVYWFLYNKLRETQYGKIPRYSTKDEEELVERYRDDRVFKDVTFGDIYNMKNSSVLTALPEHVFKKWYFGRIITLGDSAHKLNPLTGHGGNTAIESAAAFVSSLIRQLRASPSGLLNANIESVFRETQDVRQERAQEVVKFAHDQQKVEAMETPFSGLIARWVVPHLGRETILSKFADIVRVAPRLETLPLPERPRWIPYRDELPEKPINSGQLLYLAVAAAFATLWHVGKTILAIEIPDGPIDYLGSPLKTTYIGLSLVDDLLSKLVYAFSRGTHGPDASIRALAVYFFAMLLPITTVWIVEAYRNGNKRTPITWPSLWATAYQIVGIGVVAPLYYLVSVFTSAHPAYTHLSGRPIPLAVAKALLPGVVLGYALPTALIFLPYTNPITAQSTIALWQISPVLACALTWLFSQLPYNNNNNNNNDDDDGNNSKPHLNIYTKAATLHLHTAYLLTATLSFLAHAATLSYAVVETTVSLRAALALAPPTATSPDAASFLTVMVPNFWRWDFVLCVVNVLAWCLYSVYDMRRSGYITSQQAVEAAVAVIVGHVVVGPGAAYAGLWCWRESVLDGLSRSSAEVGRRRAIWY